MGCRDGPKYRTGSGPGIDLRARMRGQRRGRRVAVTPHPILRTPRAAGRPSSGSSSSVTLVERDGCRILRALDERSPERTVDAGNETDIRGVVALVGNTV